MRHLKIGLVDVFLDDLGEGRGKITVSSPNYGAFNHYWGSMGSALTEFLQRINSDYFASKLSTNTHEFSAKKSTKNLRKYIREEVYDLPFYKFMSAQKEMIELIKELETVETDRDFVDICYSIPDRLMCFELDRFDEKEFREIVEGIFTIEPWRHIDTVPTREFEWLKTLYHEIVIELKKQEEVAV